MPEMLVAHEYVSSLGCTEHSDSEAMQKMAVFIDVLRCSWSEP